MRDGTIGAMKAGDSAWTTPEALLVAPDGLVIDPDAPAWLARPEGRAVRVERDEDGFLVDRWHARGNDFVPTERADLPPVRDISRGREG